MFIVFFKNNKDVMHLSCEEKDIKLHTKGEKDFITLTDEEYYGSEFYETKIHN